MTNISSHLLIFFLGNAQNCSCVTLHLFIVLAASIPSTQALHAAQECRYANQHSYNRRQRGGWIRLAPILIGIRTPLVARQLHYGFAYLGAHAKQAIAALVVVHTTQLPPARLVVILRLLHALITAGNASTLLSHTDTSFASTCIGYAHQFGILVHRFAIVTRRGASLVTRSAPSTCWTRNI